MFTGIFQSLLSRLHDSERLNSAHSLSIIWLPLIDSHLKQSLPTLEAYEAFLDDSVIHDYLLLERFAEDPAIDEWHTDILCIAVEFHLFSYVQTQLHNNRTDKPGRPLLHYALSRGFSHPMQMLELLLSRGCRPDAYFNLRNTWQFLLIAAFSLHDRFGMDGNLAEVIPMFLQHGADPNQQVDTHDYQCFALHVTFNTNHLDYKTLEPILQNMLAKGANVNARDSKGRSVIDLARESRPEAVSLLQSYSSRSQSSSVLDSKNTMYKKIAAAKGKSDVSETCFLLWKNRRGTMKNFSQDAP